MEELKTIEFYKPKYGNKVFISYEGQYVGPIYLSDIDSEQHPLKMLTIQHGQYFIMDYIDIVRKSTTEGAIKYFSDIHRWKGNPPLVTYKVSHFI